MRHLGGRLWRGALGVTLWQMLFGRPLVEAATMNGLAVLYKLGTMTESPEVPEELPEDARTFLAGCLRLDPAERFTTARGGSAIGNQPLIKLGIVCQAFEIYQFQAHFVTARVKELPL